MISADELFWSNSFMISVKLSSKKNLLVESILGYLRQGNQFSPFVLLITSLSWIVYNRSKLGVTSASIMLTRNYKVWRHGVNGQREAILGQWPNRACIFLGDRYLVNVKGSGRINCIKSKLNQMHGFNIIKFLIKNTKKNYSLIWFHKVVEQ